MEPRIRNRYTSEIQAEVRRLFGLSPDDLVSLDGFESFLYKVPDAREPFVLRVGHSLRRPERLVLGEIDWLNYLAQGGAGVARPLASPSGRFVETIPDGRGEQFVVAAFALAPGNSPWSDGKWDAPLFANYGRLLGRIHALSREYRPSNAAGWRPAWNDPINLEGHRWLPPGDEVIRDRFDEVLAHLETLPVDDRGFGLIHQDAHPGNFFADDDLRLTLFDFDDCVYSWFVYDIAMALFYTLINEPDAAAFGPKFWSAFWPAYQQEYDLNPAWLAELPWFMKLREIDLYAVIYRSWPDGDVDDPWARRYMDGRRERIIDRLPVFDLDFALSEGDSSGSPRAADD